MPTDCRLPDSAQTELKKLIPGEHSDRFIDNIAAAFSLYLEYELSRNTREATAFYKPATPTELKKKTAAIKRHALGLGKTISALSTTERALWDAQIDAMYPSLPEPLPTILLRLGALARNPDYLTPDDRCHLMQSLNSRSMPLSEKLAFSCAYEFRYALGIEATATREGVFEKCLLVLFAAAANQGAIIGTSEDSAHHVARKTVGGFDETMAGSSLG